MSSATVDHQAEYDHRKANIKEHEAELQVELQADLATNSQIRLEISTLETRITTLRKQLADNEAKMNEVKLNRTKRPQVISINPERAIKIPWSEFLAYVTKTRDVWLYYGQMNAEHWRLSCKGRECNIGKHNNKKKDKTNGSPRKSTLTELYILHTISHGEWRLCHECVNHAHYRAGAFVRDSNSKFPALDDSTLITIDPYIYSDLKIIADLLRLGGVIVK